MSPKNSSASAQPPLPFGAIDDGQERLTDAKPASRKRSTKKRASKKAAKKTTSKKAAGRKAATKKETGKKETGKKETGKKETGKKATSKKKPDADRERDASEGSARRATEGTTTERTTSEQPNTERPKVAAQPSGSEEQQSKAQEGEQHRQRDNQGTERRRGRSHRNRRGRDKSSSSEREGPVSAGAKRPPSGGHGGGHGGAHGGGHKHHPKHKGNRRNKRHRSSDAQPLPDSAGGLFIIDKGGFGVLRRDEFQWVQSKEDIFVPKHLIQKYKLFDGMLVTGRVSRGQKHKLQLVDVQTIDGRPLNERRKGYAFKNLTSIDPDFHYAVGDSTGFVSMKIVDLLCPIGRGQRGLIVAPPRSGKTTLLREFAHGIETTYPEVHLMVLLIDERPEEATEWKRSVKNGQVFVSTADETSKRHIQLAEAVWKRAMHLVEIGEDVVLLLDSITRLARAYNNHSGNSGRTMSGGLDSRAMERPRKIFGSARNTEMAGSLTILGTTLIETGSRMDQLVFEEFKGTGNMELVLSRKLADRRIFPAIDVERSGTRKEEKLVGSRRLRLLHTLRRVLTRMNFIEAMELLITKLDDFDKTDDFLSRFEVDPEA